MVEFGSRTLDLCFVLNPGLSFLQSLSSRAQSLSPERETHTKLHLGNPSPSWLIAVIRQAVWSETSSSLSFHSSIPPSSPSGVNTPHSQSERNCQALLCKGTSSTGLLLCIATIYLVSYAGSYAGKPVATTTCLSKPVTASLHCFPCKLTLASNWRDGKRKLCNRGKKTQDIQLTGKMEEMKHMLIFRQFIKYIVNIVLTDALAHSRLVVRV